MGQYVFESNGMKTGGEYFDTKLNPIVNVYPITKTAY